MEQTNIQAVFSHFKTGDEFLEAAPFGDGHINDTYRVKCRKSDYTLQRINRRVFKKPELVMHNIALVTVHLAKAIAGEGGDPKRETISIIPTLDGEPFYRDEQGEYYRVFNFITGARSYPRVEKPEHFYNAARAFARFQNMLADFPAEQLAETIPNFHNTVSRYGDFLDAIRCDSAGRTAAVSDEIAFVKARRDKYSVITDALADGSVPVRVTHNDTKYDNILIDDVTGEGICVIDLDTVMPGSMLYDFGDSIRAGTNSSVEDETDHSKVWCRLELFEEFTRGWLEVLGAKLTPAEVDLLAFSPQLITLECGMRFLTDYLNGDVYFKIHRPNHNLDRARTQFKLAGDMENQYDDMVGIVKKYKERYCK